MNVKDPVTGLEYTQTYLYVYFKLGDLVFTQDAPTAHDLDEVSPIHSSTLRLLCAKEENFFITGTLFSGRVLRICVRRYK